MALTELKAAHQAQDVSSIDAATEKLNAAWAAASQEMYAASQEAGAGPGADGAAGQSAKQNAADDVTDVEFEEVKDNR